MNLINCERWPEKDFTDDKNSFYAYRYKGKLPITYHTKRGKYYICIRPDYLGLDHKDYSEDFEIFSYYNGVTERQFDSYKFQQFCEYMYQKYIECNIDAERPRV